MADIELTSDTTGVIWEILKQPGDAVEADEPVAIVESMKMEIPVVSAEAGHIVEIRVAKGDAVAEGDVVAIIRMS